MTPRRSVPFALLALCCASPVLSQDESVPSEAESADSGSERICRTQQTLGSRLGAKKVCLTREQWRVQQRDNRDETERAQRMRRSNFQDPFDPTTR